jgi:hypothetical protein
MQLKGGSILSVIGITRVDRCPKKEIQQISEGQIFARIVRIEADDTCQGHLSANSVSFQTADMMAAVPSVGNRVTTISPSV